MTEQTLPKNLPPIKLSGHAYDITNKVFGRLTAVRPVGLSNSNRGILWFCRCKCGAETTAPSEYLRSGRVKSCGCMRRLTLEKDKKALYKVYTHNAQKRGIEWDLSIEDFSILTSSDCHYCGAAPSRTLNRLSAPESPYLHSGIDRVNNDFGYYSDGPEDNVVPCCTTCNIAKQSMTAEEFIAWATRLVEHQQKKRSENAN